MTKLMNRVVPGLCMIVVIGTGCTRKPELERLMEAAIAVPPETMTIQIKKYKETPGRVFKHLFVSNFSIKAARARLDFSSSRDALSDALKTVEGPLYNFTVGMADSNSDGYSDLLLYLSGVTGPNQATMFCGSSQRNSSSNDALTYNDTRQAGAPLQFLGLRDCEKSFLQINPASFDFDKDGIPDYLELRAGLNPKNPFDADLSIAGDTMTNIEKVKRNIPIDERSDSQPNRLFAYVYKTEFDVLGNRIFTVSNIPILNGGVENFIAFYLIETDVATKQDFLFSAFTILRRNYVNTTLQLDFWTTIPGGLPNNQEMTAP